MRLTATKARTRRREEPERRSRGWARAVSLVALATAGLVLGAVNATGAPTRAGRAATATPGPPVITEPFKRALACNPNTTVGMEGCGEQKLAAADHQLNADVKVIYSLVSGASRRDFVAAQLRWQTYRTADCKSQSDVYSGGTEAPVVYVLCLAADDKLRRQDLKGFFAGLTQGKGKAPAFP